MPYETGGHAGEAKGREAPSDLTQRLRVGLTSFAPTALRLRRGARGWLRVVNIVSGAEWVKNAQPGLAVPLGAKTEATVIFPGLKPTAAGRFFVGLKPHASTVAKQRLVLQKRERDSPRGKR